MTDRSSSPQTSLGLLLNEIEATPKEYWMDLLETLRQFRQKIPPISSPIVDAEQAKKIKLRSIFWILGWMKKKMLPNIRKLGTS